VARVDHYVSPCHSRSRPRRPVFRARAPALLTQHLRPPRARGKVQMLGRAGDAPPPQPPRAGDRPPRPAWRLPVTYYPAGLRRGPRAPRVVILPGGLLPLVPVARVAALHAPRALPATAPSASWAAAVASPARSEAALAAAHDRAGAAHRPSGRAAPRPRWGLDEEPRGGWRPLT
jgi:hypothetical protein